MSHNYLEPEKPGSLLFVSRFNAILSSKILVYSYLERVNTGSQLFKAQKYWVTAIYNMKKTGPGYLEAQKTESMLFWTPKGLVQRYMRRENTG